MENKISFRKRIQEIKIIDLVEHINVKSLFLIYVLLIFLINIIRYANLNPSLLGTFSYYHAINSLEPFNFVKFDLYEFILKINPPLFSKIMPILLSIGLLYFIYIYLENYHPIVNSKIYLFLLVLSPFFLYLGSISNNLVLYTLMFLIAMYFYKKSNHRVADVLIFISSFFSIPLAIFSLFILGVNKIKRGAIASIIATVLSLILKNINIISLELSFDSFINSIIFDLGSRYGLSMFLIALSIFGFVYVFKNKYKFFSGIAALVIFSLFAFFIHFHFIFFLGFIVVYFGALGVEKIINREWQSIFIKELAIIVMTAGLLFSALSFVNQVSHSEPNKQTYDALSYLDKVTSQNAIVLSDPSRGFWIDYYSSAKPFTTELSPLAAKRITSLIFANRDISSTKELLNDYGINLLFLDGEMKSGLVWTYPDEGLLLLLESNETFKRLYSNNNGDEIWEVISR